MSAHDVYATEIPITGRQPAGRAPTMADEPGTWVSIPVDAPVEEVWELVSDIGLPARFSEEFLGAEWIDGQPAVGARFVGNSENRYRGRWATDCFIDRYLPLREFGWVTEDFANPGARWCFVLTPTAGGREHAAGQATELRFEMAIGPGPSGLVDALAAHPDRETAIVSRRLADHHANMRRTVVGIAELLSPESR